MRAALLASLLAMTFAAQAKPTPRREDPFRVALSMVIDHSARPDSEIERQVILNSALQSCVRQALLPQPQADFDLIVRGRIAEDGSLGSFNFKSLSGPKFDACLSEALSHIRLSPGEAGPFGFHLERAAPGGTPAKTIILDLSPTKIYQ